MAVEPGKGADLQVTSEEEGVALHSALFVYIGKKGMRKEND